MSKRKARAIRWSANAIRDLDQIAAYIARDNPQAAHAARSGFCSSSVVNLGPVLSDCIGGVCVQRFCDANNDCNDNDDCTSDTCDSFSNRCTNPDAPSGTRCNGGTGRCLSGVFGSICVPDIVIGG